MKTEELYTEVPCQRCGKSRLKWSSFCPHCGYVQEESFLERLRSRLGGGGSPSRTALAVAIALLGLGTAAVLAAEAIAEGRIRDLIAIATIAVLSIRAFLHLRKKTGQANAPEPDGAADDDVGEEDANARTPHPACENCGAVVQSDAVQCPKCGARFA